MTSIRRLPLFPSAGSRRAEWAARVREKAFLNIWTKRWSVSHFDQGVLVEEGRCLRKGIRSVRTMSECAYRLCVVLGTPRRGACRCARLDARARGVRSANAVSTPAIPEPIVEAVRLLLPQLDGVRHDSITAPTDGTLKVCFRGEGPSQFADLFLEALTVWYHLALMARDGTSSCSDRPRGPVGVRFRIADGFDRTH